MMVLLIHDEEWLLEVLRAMLRRADVDVVGRGHDRLDHLGLRHLPDLVLIQTGPSARDLIQDVQTLRLTMPAVPVVAITERANLRLLASLTYSIPNLRHVLGRPVSQRQILQIVGELQSLPAPRLAANH